MNVQTRDRDSMRMDFSKLLEQTMELDVIADQVEKVEEAITTEFPNKDRDRLLTILRVRWAGALDRIHKHVFPDGGFDEDDSFESFKPEEMA